jgi:hypothetical protein
MVTKPRRRGSSIVWAAIVLLGLPAMANAQFQLFPNAHKKRERPSCLTEPPIYKITRQQYFGYYPTCWQRFPQGWGCPCPNPEKPVPGAAATGPDRSPDREGPGIQPPLNDLGRPRRRDDSGIPALPPETTSPFELEPRGPVRAPEPPQDRRPADAPLPGPTNGATFDAPSMTPPLSDAADDPFSGVRANPPGNMPVVDASPILPVGAPSRPGFAPEPVNTFPPAMQAPQRRSVLGSLWDRVRR